MPEGGGQNGQNGYWGSFGAGRASTVGLPEDEGEGEKECPPKKDILGHRKECCHDVHQLLFVQQNLEVICCIFFPVCEYVFFLIFQSFRPGGVRFPRLLELELSYQMWPGSWGGGKLSTKILPHSSPVGGRVVKYSLQTC